MISRVVLLIAFASLLAACGESAGSIALRSRPDAPSEPETDPVKALAEGDLLLIEASPSRGGCVTAESSAPAIVEVRGVRGQCQLFVLAARAAGHANISFRAGEATVETELDVSPVAR